MLLIHLMLTYLVLVLISLASANRHEYHPSAKSRATSLQGSIALQATRQCTNTQVNRCQSWSSGITTSDSDDMVV